MRFIKKQLSLWRIVLIIGVTAIAIPIGGRVTPTAIAVVNERQDYLHQQITADYEDADLKYSKRSKAAAGEGIAPLQDDDYYDRRRDYWERRVERELDRQEGEESADDNDADTTDSKATKDKDSKDAADDEDDDVDQEIERRREYWRKRLEKEW